MERRETPQVGLRLVARVARHSSMWLVGPQSGSQLELGGEVARRDVDFLADFTGRQRACLKLTHGHKRRPPSGSSALTGELPQVRGRNWPAGPRPIGATSQSRRKPRGRRCTGTPVVRTLAGQGPPSSAFRRSLRSNPNFKTHPVSERRPRRPRPVWPQMGSQPPRNPSSHTARRPLSSSRWVSNFAPSDINSPSTVQAGRPAAV